MISNGGQKTVVIVDDSDDIREYLEAALAGDGWRTVACADAAGAFEAVRRERPRLLITDVALGVSSGLDLITRLRSDLSPPLPPIIVISGFDHYESEAIERGADAFVPKPFDWDTMRATIATVIGHESPPDSARAEAIRRSQQRRAEALEAARIALARLDHRNLSFDERGSWAAHFLARYIGFGEAVIALLSDGFLRVVQSTNPARWRRGDPFELPLCKQILETNSTLVVPDLIALSARSHEQGRCGGVRFLAGVPLCADNIAIGVACLLSRSPGQIDPEDLALISHFARQGSELLSSARPALPPLVSDAGIATRATLRFLVRSELARARHEELALRILAVAGAPPRAELGRRSAVAELGPERYALFLSVADGEPAWEESLALIHHSLDESAPRAGVFLSIEGDTLAAFNADVILTCAEALLEQRLLRGDAAVEQVVIRRQPLATPSPQPSAATEVGA